MTLRRILAITSVVGAIAVLMNPSSANDRLAELFKRYDKDGNGKITAAELRQPGLFRLLDADQDGSVTLEETRSGALRALRGRGSREAPASKTIQKSVEAKPIEGTEDDAIRQSPKPLKPALLGVGRQIPDLQFVDIKGNKHRLSNFGKSKATVIVMTNTQCPLCLKYAPSLSKLEKEYTARQIQFVFVNSGEAEKLDSIKAAVAKNEFQSPYVHDSDKAVTRALAASTTTEVFVLDKTRTLVYRGAVDDQYGFGYSLDKPRQPYLARALDSILANKAVAVAATSSPGCELFYDKNQPVVNTSLTYHKDISRTIQSQCIQCHRSGGIAPITLETYAQVKDNAAMIANVVKRKVMPPWFAKPIPVKDGEVATSSSSHWANDPSLTKKQIDELLTWVNAGAPEGDKKDAPLPRQFPDGWLIGKPDQTFEFEKPVKVKATGFMRYVNVTVETDLTEDKWVQAIEVRPSQPAVVHHVIVSVRDSSSRRRRGTDGLDFWGVYVPGNSTLIYPDGYAKRLPKGAKLRFQMHYTPNGTATEDKTSIGLVYAKEPPKHEVRVAGIVNRGVKIPAFAGNHHEEVSIDVPHDIDIIGFLPHMHLRGKKALYQVDGKGGSTRTLLDIPRYDFNWQLVYRLAQPQRVKKGESIRFTAWFDNSSGNPAIDDSHRTVGWGSQTYDEMQIGYIEYTTPYVPVGRADSAMVKALVDGAGRASLFRRLDNDASGTITREEFAKQLRGRVGTAIFDRLDTDDDDELTPREAAKFRR